MPVYNERATIEEILFRVQAVNIEKEIIVVDDGSSDGTREYLAELATCIDSNSPSKTNRAFNLLPRLDNIRIFFQEHNCGKGAALRRGFQETHGEVVIIQDADLELDPQDYYRLIDPIVRGLTDVVYGSRFLGRARQGVPFSSYAANKLLTLASNIVTGLNLTDAWIGYKVFRREVLEKITLREDRFGFEPEITAKVAKCGHRVFEVPVSYSCRTRAEGKKIRWKDGLRGLWCTLRYGLFS
jgi:glycosyltransferase involved in cell wall biosynthesis